jgi:hypothetical protein
MRFGTIVYLELQTKRDLPGDSKRAADDSPSFWPQDTDRVEKLARYLLRCPLPLSRTHWKSGARTLFYEGKSSRDEPFAGCPKQAHETHGLYHPLLEGALPLRSPLACGILC